MAEPEGRFDGYQRYKKHADKPDGKVERYDDEPKGEGEHVARKQWYTHHHTIARLGRAYQFPLITATTSMAMITAPAQ